MLLLFFIDHFFKNSKTRIAILCNERWATLSGAQGWCLCLMSLTPQVDRTGGRPVTVIPVIVVNGVWLVKKSSGVLSSIDERKNVWSDILVGSFFVHTKGSLEAWEDSHSAKRGALFPVVKHVNSSDQHYQRTSVSTDATLEHNKW